jgi:hypothetical protein
VGKSRLDWGKEKDEAVRGGWENGDGDGEDLLSAIIGLGDLIGISAWG